MKDFRLDDLLERKQKDLDLDKIEKFVTNKVILITGAGGSIGSEIVRLCVAFKAKNVILVENNEYNLYSMLEEFRKEENVVPVMQNIVDKVEINKIFNLYKPNIVIHAAAYKHVPLVESNITSAIINNIVGTKNIIDLSIKYNVNNFILVSTDKAVRPTNVMGTTKRICELYLQNVNSKDTKISAVRFGNVLGSSGSVIPKFRTQIEQDKNITVTHPEITRYFMLIKEACELVLQAGSMGKSGEIFILNMGEPVKIVNLAKKMIKLSGKKNIKIDFCGLRPGEKLFEELLIDDTDCTTKYSSITIANPTNYNIDKLNKELEILLSLDTDKQKLDYLKIIVPEFDHKNN